MWTFAVCKADPMALFGKQRISAATTTFQLKPKALKAPEKKYGSIEGIYRFLIICFFVKLKALHISKSSVSTFLKPWIMAVVIIGKVIKIPIKTGTVFDLNQKRVSKIRETTGVALIIARGSLKKFSMPRLRQESKPINNEKAKEREKAKRLLKIVAKRCFLKADSESNEKNLLNTAKGSGKTSSESMWFARIFQKIIIAKSGKTIIWKKSFIFSLENLFVSFLQFKIDYPTCI